MKKFDKKIALDIILYSSWFGVITGLVEGIALYIFQHAGLLKGQITYLGSSWEVVWITPIFDLLFFLIIGLLLAVVAQFIPQTISKRIVLFVFSFLLAFAWVEIYLSGRLNPAATAVLAAGIAYQISLALYERESKFQNLIQKTIKGLASVALMLVILIQGGFWLKEQTASRNLPAAQISAPNVLVIVVDALRADHLSLQGYDRETDPTLKRLASEGVMFENAYSASSWTLTSHASLFTGRWPSPRDASRSTLHRAVDALRQKRRPGTGSLE